MATPRDLTHVVSSKPCHYTLALNQNKIAYFDIYIYIYIFYPSVFSMSCCILISDMSKTMISKVILFRKSLLADSERNEFAS